MEEVQKILHTTPFGALATHNGHVVPLHFAVDRENIYWFSDEDARHSRAIAKNGKVEFVVFTNDRLPDLHAVHVKGLAQIASDWTREYDDAKKAFGQKFGAIPAEFTDYKLYILPLGKIAKSTGHKYELEEK